MEKLPFCFIFLLTFAFCRAEDPCTINIDCEDCLPEFPPLVHSHTTRTNILVIQHGDKVHFHCNQGKFIAYPNKSELEAYCENGNFRTEDDKVILMHVSELGCDIDFYDDVLHDVDYCRNPYQGRSYQYRNRTTNSVVHLAEVCYDAEKGRTMFVHMDMCNGNDIQNNHHVDRENRMSLLGNFNKMFDKSNKLEAENIYDISSSLAKKIEYMMGKHHFNFVDHNLVATKLIPASFYQNQNGRVSNFVSNKVALWKSVANGNFRNIQNDITDAFKRQEMNSGRSLEVFIGTHDTLSLPVRNQYFELFLKPGKKYPVPKYIWTIVYNKKEHKAVVLVLINNPFTSISEVRNSVFCPSVCNSLNWINSLKFNNNFERSVYGLVFCCDLHSFSNIVSDIPKLTQEVHATDRGILRDGFM